MFTKLLIANRGEIALRILRAAHDLGLPAVAVFARDDAGTAHAVLADEAVALGLATRCCADPLAEARAMAAAIAQRSPSAVRAAKRLLNQAQRTLDGSAAELLQAESDEQAAIIGGPNQVEAVRANLEGRAPKFID